VRSSATKRKNPDPPARARKAECASKAKKIDSRERVFFIPSQASIAPGKNASAYDECSSGRIIYAYVGGNPVSDIDPEGLAGCVANFPDYPIDTGFGVTSTSLGGHGGVLSYDSQGATKYYEYGRYAPTDPLVIGDKRPQDDGNVRRVPVPDLQIDPRTGQPTPASMDALRRALSNRAGHNTRTDLTCEADADEKKISKYAEDYAKNASRPKYSWKPWSSNQCRDFANRALGAGR
jgi:uncharacterized protein RhaS with RHS repeats